MKSVLSTAAALSASAAFTAVLFAQGTAARPAPQAKVAPSSSSFVQMVAEGGQAEIEMATTAESKSSNSQVKSLAQTIHRDHESANSDLKTIAEQQHITWPSSLSKAHQASAERLNKLSGNDFDKAYVDDMVKDHRADIATFQKHKTDPDPEVAAWVAKTLPTLQNHLTMALDAQKSIGKH